MTDTERARALLTEPMRQVLDRMSRVRQLPLYALPPEQARGVYAMGSSMLDIAPQDLARVEDLHFTARDGTPIPVRLYAPSREALPLPTLLYFHGGGFTIGSISTHDALCRRLCHLAQCAVVSVDYRLAPEQTFPTATHDAWDALHFVHTQGSSLGLDPQRLAVGGDSAGGTLATVCALHAKQVGIDLALQMLFYPGCAGDQSAPSHQTFGKGFAMESAHISYFYEHYTRNAHERQDWRFAPLLAEDVDNAAPVWMGLAECDPLVDEGLLYADKLRSAGVPVALEMYRGVVHDFVRMGRLIPEALQAQQDAAAALRLAFEG
jgi:acetyl esterase